MINVIKNLEFSRQIVKKIIAHFGDPNSLSSGMIFSVTYHLNLTPKKMIWLGEIQRFKKNCIHCVDFSKISARSNKCRKRYCIAFLVFTLEMYRSYIRSIANGKIDQRYLNLLDCLINQLIFICTHFLAQKKELQNSMQNIK